MRRMNCASERDGESSGPAEYTLMVAPSRVPSPPRELPTMSLLNQAWIGMFSAFAFFACAAEPINPCSSPATAMNTSVASNSIPLSAKTRASSIDSTVRSRHRSLLARRRCSPGWGSAEDRLASDPPASAGSPGACACAPGRCTSAGCAARSLRADSPAVRVLPVSCPRAPRFSES